MHRRLCASNGSPASVRREQLDELVRHEHAGRDPTRAACAVRQDEGPAALDHACREVVGDLLGDQRAIARVAAVPVEL